MCSERKVKWASFRTIRTFTSYEPKGKQKVSCTEHVRRKAGISFCRRTRMSSVCTDRTTLVRSRRTCWERASTYTTTGLTRRWSRTCRKDSCQSSALFKQLSTTLISLQSDQEASESLSTTWSRKRSKSSCNDSRIYSPSSTQPVAATLLTSSGVSRKPQLATSSCSGR